MRFSLLATSLLSAATAALAATAATADNHLAEVSAAWPKANPFARVTNGVSTNLLQLRFQNHDSSEVQLTGVRGEFREAGGKERVLRKTSALPLRQPVPAGQKSPLIPYRFASENKVGEVGLRVFVDYLDGSKKKQSVLAYDDVVNVVEPPTSWFDLELLSVYAILLALFSGAGYLAYTTFLASAPTPSSKRSSGGKSTAVVATSDVIDGGMAEAEKKLDESWIPEHHRRAGGKKGKAGYTSATSGDESEGGKKKRR
ncbi:hypothetical protein JCM6882_006018 [Rhodosporidiobolus microsporus]